MKQIIAFCTLILACLVILACPEPIPLHGTWADNDGNSISFSDDNTFSAQIAGTDGGHETYSGNYSIRLNSLKLNCTETGKQIVTEWDIRGNILYIKWVNGSGDTVPLTLLKVAD